MNWKDKNVNHGPCALDPEKECSGMTRNTAETGSFSQPDYESNGFCTGCGCRNVTYKSGSQRIELWIDNGQIIKREVIGK